MGIRFSRSVEEPFHKPKLNEVRSLRLGESPGPASPSESPCSNSDKVRDD